MVMGVMAVKPPGFAGHKPVNTAHLWRAADEFILILQRAGVRQDEIVYERHRPGVITVALENKSRRAKVLMALRGIDPKLHVSRHRVADIFEIHHGKLKIGFLDLSSIPAKMVKPRPE